MQTSQEQNAPQLSAGTGSNSNLSADGSRLLITPTATYKRGGAKTDIIFTITPCTLGWLLVAKTTKGVCAVRLGNDEHKLEADFRLEFHAANIRHATGEGKETLATEIEHLQRLIHGQEPQQELSLDIPGTLFQWRVWQELMKIPCGQTASYGEIAARIGNPKAARAVGAACGQNPVALVIPCHRVIAKNGSFNSYEWGVSRKRKLLENERVK